MSKTKLGLKFNRFTYRLRHDFFTKENIVLIVAVILCIIWTFQSITSMSRNWQLAEKLSSEKKSLELLNVEIEALSLENEYYSSEEYQELAARKHLNKQLNGEKLVYLPENSDAAKYKHQTNKIKAPEKVYSNPEKWFMFLFPDTF